MAFRCRLLLMPLQHDVCFTGTWIGNVMHDKWRCAVGKERAQQARHGQPTAIRRIGILGTPVTHSAFCGVLHQYDSLIIVHYLRVFVVHTRLKASLLGQYLM
jgi:hypothetical protein